MKFKESIVIFGKEYKIKIKKNLKCEEGVKCDGLFSESKATIFLDASLKKKDLKETLIHESLHGVFRRNSLCEVVDEKVEEVIVESITKFLGESFRISFK